MTNPILVELTRGGAIESWHRGAYAIVDDTGIVIASAGDIEAPVYPRSAVKPMQALPLVASGAATTFGFGTEALALACASHNGERDHARIAREMLKAAGLSEGDLECGSHPSLSAKVAHDMARDGIEPTPCNHNCSGKHAGMLAVAAHIGEPTRGYVAADHPVQRQIAAMMSEFTDYDITTRTPGVDGCSVPTWAIPLQAMALGCARFATGKGVSATAGAAARAIYDAATAHPFLVAGTGRFCTEAMETLGPAALVKTGAEGVYCAMLRDKRLGIAVKIDDGARRAAQAVCAALLHRIFGDEAGADTLMARAHDPIVSVRGEPVGELRIRLDPA